MVNELLVVAVVLLAALLLLGCAVLVQLGNVAAMLRVAVEHSLQEPPPSPAPMPSPPAYAPVVRDDPRTMWDPEDGEESGDDWADDYRKATGQSPDDGWADDERRLRGTL